MASGLIECGDNIDIHEHGVPPRLAGYPTIFLNADNTFLRTLL